MLSIRLYCPLLILTCRILPEGADTGRDLRPGCFQPGHIEASQREPDPFDGSHCGSLAAAGSGLIRSTPFAGMWKRICPRRLPLDEVDISDPENLRSKLCPYAGYNSDLLVLDIAGGTECRETPSSASLRQDHCSSKGYQEYGIEDARVSFIQGKYYMTTCSVSSERHSRPLCSADGMHSLYAGRNHPGPSE